MSKIRPRSYIVIQPFMAEDLKLKGNDLLVYAIIHGLSQDGKSVFTGSTQYLADWTSSTQRGIRKTISSLLDKGMLEKITSSNHPIQPCGYRAVVPEFRPEQSSSEAEQSSSEAEQSSSEAEQSSSEAEQSSSTHYNLVYNLDNNLVDNAPHTPRGGFERFWEAYPKKVGKRSALAAFNRIRGVSVETMVAAIKQQEASKQWREESGRFIPNPTTWLNQGRWEDEPATERCSDAVQSMPSDDIGRMMAESEETPWK